VDGRARAVLAFRVTDRTLVTTSFRHDRADDVPSIHPDVEEAR
jgi:hypothetical protein